MLGLFFVEGIERIGQGGFWGGDGGKVIRLLNRFKWDNMAVVLGDAVESIIR